MFKEHLDELMLIDQWWQWKISMVFYLLKLGWMLVIDCFQNCLIREKGVIWAFDII